MTDLIKEIPAPDTLYLSVRSNDCDNFLLDEWLLFLTAFYMCLIAWSWTIYGVLT